MPSSFKISASLICGNHLDLKSDLKLLKRGGADLIHFDVMDGLFVPRFGLYPEILTAVKKISNIPVETHLMIEDPDKYIELYANSGSDYIYFHPQASKHISRTLKLIKLNGKKSGIVLDPEVSPETLSYLVDDIDAVMIMGINPGIIGHKLIPATLKKISLIKSMFSGHNILIEVDGGVTPESAPQMVKLGANALVCGSSTIYGKDKPLDSMIRTFRKKVMSQI
jgi:ribulose-phosphate 3-epimerase